MAPRLACVCSSWSAAVTATPELWHILDTAAVPNKSWPQSRQLASPTKQGRKRAAASRQLTAEQGLSLWVASGRLQELQSLLLYGDSTSATDAADGSCAGHNRQLSAQLLDHIVGSCQQLRRLSIIGALSLRPEVSCNCRGCAGTSSRQGPGLMPQSTCHLYLCKCLGVVSTRQQALLSTGRA